MKLDPSLKWAMFISHGAPLDRTLRVGRHLRGYGDTHHVDES